MKKLNKQIKKQLHEIADQLPPIPMADKIKVTGLQILTDEQYIKHRNQSIDPKKKYIIRKGGSICAVNHRKRLEKVFAQGGIEAVKEYANHFKN